MQQQTFFCSSCLLKRNGVQDKKSVKISSLVLTAHIYVCIFLTEQNVTYFCIFAIIKISSCKERL